MAYNCKTENLLHNTDMNIWPLCEDMVFKLSKHDLSRFHKKGAEKNDKQIKTLFFFHVGANMVVYVQAFSQNLCILCTNLSSSQVQ